METSEVISTIEQYQKKVHDTDIKVRQFLSDRKRYPHPLHEELIERIRQYERSVDRFLRANRNAEIELKMDNLLYSAMVHEKAWKRLFENAAHVGNHEIEAARAAAAQERTDDAQPALSTQEQRLIDKIYHIAKSKWDQYGIESAESKTELASRLIPEYQKIKEKIRTGKKLGVVYDKRSHRVKFKVKEP